MAQSVLSSKGQVTIPSEVRRKLGLEPGTVVEFEVLRDRAILRKATRGEHPVDRVYGSVRLQSPVDELLDEMRGPRPARSRKP